MEYYNDNLPLDKISIITSLYKRDLIKNYFPQEQVIKYLKQLNYYNIDTHKESKKYLINTINNMISIELNNNFNSIKNKTIQQLIFQIKQSDDYKNFISKINTNIERAFVLSKYIIECNNVLNFYNALTIEELNDLHF